MTREEAWRRTKGYLYDSLDWIKAVEIIEALEQEDILDKIRAEIEEHALINQNLNPDRARALCWCLDVIDMYKEESEMRGN